MWENQQWPKFENMEVGLRLAFIGSIKDEIINTEELAIELIKFLKSNYPGAIGERFGIDENIDNILMLDEIAKTRKLLLKGNELNVEKAAAVLIDEFRSGQLGRISLERVENEQ